MALTRAAIIVIVLVACLAVTALGAAIFRHYNPSEDEGRYNFSHEQQQYMRSVRLRNLAALRAEAMAARHELDSRYMATPEGSGYYSAHPPHASHPPSGQESYVTTPH